jgi:hypothetical protein
MSLRAFSCQKFLNTIEGRAVFMKAPPRFVPMVDVTPRKGRVSEPAPAALQCGYRQVLPPA